MEANVSVSSVISACKNFVLTGRPVLGYKGRARRVIPEDILDFITGTAGLNELKFLSLKQRCEVLFQKFAFRIGVHGLTSLYKRAGIGYRYSRPQSRRLLNEAGMYKAEVRELRRKAAEDLLNMLAGGQSITFVDECSIQSQQGKQRTWIRS